MERKSSKLNGANGTTELNGSEVNGAELELNKNKPKRGAPFGNKRALGNKGGGRPSKYDPKFAEQARALCEEAAASDRVLAAVFKVDLNTIYAWKSKHIEFSRALTAGKEPTDDLVVNSMHELATGFERECEEVKWLKRQVPAKDKKGEVITKKNGDVVMVEEYVSFKTTVKRYFPPNAVAGQFWLTNRRRKDWTTQQDHVHQHLELTYEDKRSISVFEERINRIAERIGAPRITVGPDREREETS